MNDEHQQQDYIIEPDTVRGEKPDFRNTLWRHINETRYYLAKCFANGISKQGLRTADAYLNVLNSLVTGISDPEYTQQWGKLHKQTDKWRYSQYQNPRQDIINHHSLLIQKLETVIKLLGRKGEFPEERVTMKAE